MKTNWTLFAFVLSLILLQSCSESKFDYRHKYVGDFAVTGTWDNDAYNSNEVWAIKDICVVDFGQDKGTLHFKTAEWGISFEGTVDRNGLLQVPDWVFVGRFSDKDHFEASAQGASPMGDWSAWTLHGVRK
jgi:hypothetical protein